MASMTEDKAEDEVPFVPLGTDVRKRSLLPRPMRFVVLVKLKLVAKLRVPLRDVSASLKLIAGGRVAFVLGVTVRLILSETV